MLKNAQATQPTSGTTLTYLYLSHFLGALDSLQQTYLGDAIRLEQFGIQINYLTALLPNDEIRQDIIDKMQKKKADLKALKINETNATIGAGMLVVSAVMSYLNSELELSVEDVVGSVVGDIGLEIPHLEEAAEGEPTAEAPGEVTREETVFVAVGGEATATEAEQDAPAV